MAAEQGVSVSEFIRERRTSTPNNDEDQALRAGMVDQVNKSTRRAEKTLTKGLKVLANMKPQTPDNSADLFRSQLPQILNMSYPLVRLSERMNCEALESEIDVIIGMRQVYPQNR